MPRPNCASNVSNFLLFAFLLQMTYYMHHLIVRCASCSVLDSMCCYTKLLQVEGYLPQMRISRESQDTDRQKELRLFVLISNKNRWG